MAFDLATARARLGIPAGDTSKDAQITAVMNASLGIAERYCDRRFMLDTETEEFIHFSGSSVQLERFPIVAVSAVMADETAVSTFQVNRNGGRVVFNGCGMAALLLEVTYEGGYAVLPDDLELALWMIFDGVWPTIGGGSGTGSSAGPISRITVPDVGSISFDTGAANNSGGGLNGMIAEGATAILDLYRRPSC